MTDSPATAKIAVAAATYWVDRPFDYRIPPALADKVVPGVRVVVPFGGGNRRTVVADQPIDGAVFDGNCDLFQHWNTGKSLCDSLKNNHRFALRRRYQKLPPASAAINTTAARAITTL